MLQHDALAYLVHDAGLEVMDVIQESEDVQPSAARLMELVRRIREEKPVLIAGEPQYSDKPAQTLRAKPACPQRSLIRGLGSADAPLSYYEAVMTANCKTLERYFDPR